MGYDVAVIGGGVAGMASAAFLAGPARVVVLEAEPILSYHASGRSAALYTECYGPGIVPTLAKASRSFLMDREEPLGSPRGVLFVADGDRHGRIDELEATFRREVPSVRRLTDRECRILVPALRPDLEWLGLHEPGALDLDINGLEATYRTMVRSGGGEIRPSHAVQALERSGGGPWRISTTSGPIEADMIVNAAGAWADTVAEMAGVTHLGLRPLRRCAFLVSGPEGSSTWPMTIDVDERWYCKPEGRNLLGSTADEVPSDPVDARPADEDVALGIERINGATTLGIRSVLSTWAGLRTFTSDRIPAVGPDAAEPTFVWVAGLGGYGIKTSPAIGELVAGLVLDNAVPERLTSAGITAGELAPRRLR